ncbi:hypothetical protein QBC47DRAFT_390969 [Echria macrotheca]|uniref:WW domain-containing protein n=1 Tax=Echria macrotheca TaxID=438768 RepID=A0AAJ0B4Y0_9PEZI|nr:hypothetical protein QBC47DRAFT_390969 [Echria macrotheca]
MSTEAKSREPTPEKAPSSVRGDAGSEDGEVDDSSPSPSSPSKSNAEAPSRGRDTSAGAASSPARSDNQDEPAATDPEAPPLPNEPVPGADEQQKDSAAPPLPSEPLPAPEPEDDGWECHWNPNTSSYWFYNRFTSVWQQENPRVPGATGAIPVPAVSVPETQDRSIISDPVSVAGGYNPAIHGDYDENAWYAQNARVVTDPSAASSASTAILPGGSAADPTAAAAGGLEYASGGFFNVRTGQWQLPEQGVERHSDEAKSKRQMNAFFDVDAAANMHDGRSLKAERAGKKPSKAELKMFKEKRRAKKEEKRRAWLRD